MKREQRTDGLTLVELMVAVVIVVVLVTMVELITPGCWAGSLSRAHATQMLSNMKQLHLATQQMVLDGKTTGDKTLGWPGDTGGNFAMWATNLVPSYLGTNDFKKLLVAPGNQRRGWHLPWEAEPTEGMPMANTNGVLVYAVGEHSASNAIFLSSANFTNTPGGGVTNTNSRLFDRKYIVVMGLGGAGQVVRTGVTNAGDPTPREHILVVSGPGSVAGGTTNLGAYVPLLK